jgi:cell wall-associated NlpC family hydrolase
LIVPGMVLTIPAGATPPPAPTAPAPPSTGPVSAGSTYTVRAGDSLSRIASRQQVSLSALLASNSLTVTSLIVPGMVLTIPAGATPPPTSVPPAPQPVAPASTAPSTPPAAGTGGGGVETVVAYALAQQGKPYQFFTAGPASFDCSGLTKAAYAQIGIALVHQSAAQAKQGVAVDFLHEPIRAGDLVFQATRADDVINHVGIAVDATHWVHATKPGVGVRLAPLPTTSVFAVRRLVPAS